MEYFGGISEIGKSEKTQSIRNIQGEVLFFYQETDSRADGSSCGIQYEIIDICGARKHELKDLNAEREEKAGSDRLDVSVELPEYKRQYDPDGDEHGNVADNISLPALIPVREKVEWLQVELGREPVQLRVDQAESAFGHREVEDNDNAYVDQEKHELVLYIRLMCPRKEEADQDPDDRDHEDGLCFMKDEHCKFLLFLS